jgi:hypothetical protein
MGSTRKTNEKINNLILNQRISPPLRGMVALGIGGDQRGPMASTKALFFWGDQDGPDSGVTPDLCFASDGWLACHNCRLMLPSSAEISPMRFSASHVVLVHRDRERKPAETCQEQIETLPAKETGAVSAEKEEESAAEWPRWREWLAVCRNDLPRLTTARCQMSIISTASSERIVGMCLFTNVHMRQEHYQAIHLTHRVLYLKIDV